MCVSMVHQYLESTNCDLADEFKTRHQPKQTNVKLKEVLSKWNEEQLARGMVYHHLRTVTPSLALQFRDDHYCSLDIVPYQLLKLVKEAHQAHQTITHTKLKDEDQLVRSIVYEHLTTVAPSLALEFRDAQHFPLKKVPKQIFKLVGMSQKKHQAKVGTREIFSAHEMAKSKREVNNNRKAYTFTTEEVMRIEKAIANKEDPRTVAKEMGRNYNTVRRKIHITQKVAGFHSGKFTNEENERIEEALKNNEDYRHVAKDLCRDPRTVQTRMLNMKCNPRQQQEQGKKKREYSLEEDLLILEKVIPRLINQTLSSTGFISQSDAMELATELQRNFKCVIKRWEAHLQCWLLQHYTGTVGFRVESMLTRLVAQKYKDYKGVDWSEIVSQHKEFAGHTRTSINELFQRCVLAARKLKKSNAVSLEEVAECTVVYQPRNNSAAKISRRGKIMEYFNKRVDELGINIVI